jgi:hypothetical protein
VVTGVVTVVLVVFGVVITAEVVVVVLVEADVVVVVEFVQEARSSAVTTRKLRLNRKSTLFDILPPIGQRNS